MKGSATSSSSVPIPDISIDNQNNTLMIRIENPSTFEKYIGNYTYEKLPIQFRVLFQSLNQFYSFLNTNIEEKVRVEKGNLHIGVNIIGKEKQFHLPLEQIALTPEEELKKKLWLLQNQLLEAENNLLQKDNQILTLKDNLKDKDKVIEEKDKILSNMSALINEKENQLVKLNNLVRHYKNQIQGLHDQDYKPTKIQEQQLQDSKMTEEFTPIKKTPYNSKAKKIRQMQEYGHKVILKLDQNSKHYNKFKISGNQVQKLHGPTYQIFNKTYLARQGKFYFDIHIKEIKNNNIVVGITTDKNKEEQFSFKKMNCVCYNGYDGSICEQEKQKYANVKPSSGNRIRTVVDMNRSEMEWYIMGGDHRVLIGKALIPASMVKQHIYPYFELYWQGNKVRLNPNP